MVDRAFSLTDCCCCEQCPDLTSCTACGAATDEAAVYEAVVQDYPASVECAYDPPGTPCDLSVVNGTYELTWDHTDDASAGDVTDITCVYTGSAEIGLIPGGCFGTGGDEHPVSLDLTLSVNYVHDRRFCACATTISVAAELRNDLGLWDRKSGSRSFDRALTCDEIVALVVEAIGAIGDCFLGPVTITLTKV